MARRITGEMTSIHFEGIEVISAFHIQDRTTKEGAVLSACQTKERAGRVDFHSFTDPLHDFFVAPPAVATHRAEPQVQGAAEVFASSRAGCIVPFGTRARACRRRPFLPTHNMRACDHPFVIRKKSDGVNSYVQTRQQAGCFVWRALIFCPSKGVDFEKTLILKVRDCTNSHGRRWTSWCRASSGLLCGKV